MIDFDNILGPPMVKPIVKKKARQPVYVGLPRQGTAFTVHPSDHTPDDKRAYIYYSKDDKCTYIISHSAFNGLNIIEAGIENLSEAILYRGKYHDGTEILIPLCFYGNAYEQSVKKMLDDGRSGLWLMRKENAPHGGGLEYEVVKVTTEPNWSSLSFDQVLDKAFDNYVVDSPTHPVAVSQFKQVWNTSKAD